MKFSIKDFFSKYDQIHSFQSLTENLIFCAVIVVWQCPTHAFVTGNDLKSLQTIECFKMSLELFKGDDKCFLFHVKNSFALEIFTFLSWLFGCLEKRLDKKVMVNFKIWDVTDCTTNNYKTLITQSFNPVDTGRKLNVHKKFRRRPGRLLNVLCTFNLRPASTGKKWK